MNSLYALATSIERRRIDTQPENGRRCEEVKARVDVALDHLRQQVQEMSAQPAEERIAAVG